MYGLYGLKHHTVGISGDVTIRDGRTNDEQGKIMLLSLWMLEGWVSQKQYELEIFLRFHISNTDHIIDVVEGRQVYSLLSQQSRV